MPNPKRRFSRSRTRKKRAAKLRLIKANTAVCPQCKQPKLPHRICLSCGYYNAKQIIKIKKKKEKKKRR